MSTILARLDEQTFVEADARLSTSRDLHDRPNPNSWFITHGLGGPAGGTYTEVVLPLVEDGDGAPLPDAEQQRIAEPLVRLVAVGLYGTAWAFLYPPREYADAIERHRMRLREVVIVDDVEVQS